MRLFLCLLVALNCYAQISSEPQIEIKQEVAQEKQQVEDKAAVEKLTWEDMVSRHGEDLKYDYNVVKYCIEEEPGTLQVYNQPIRYEEGGEVKPIKLSWEQGTDSVFENLTNSLQSKIYKDGSVQYSNIQQKFSVKVVPIGMFFDTEQVIDEADANEFKQLNAHTITYNGIWPLGTLATWRSNSASVKETLWVNEEFRTALEKSGATEVRIKTRIESDYNNWAVIIQEQAWKANIINSETGQVLLSFDDIIVTDEAGNETFGHYEYEDGILTTVIEAPWFLEKDRVYPVGIDPSTTKDDENEFNNCGAGGGTGDRNRFFIKFNLPGLDTLTSCDFVSELSQNGLFSETIDTNIYTSASSAWVSNSSTCATMDALTYYNTGVNNAFTSATGQGTKTWANIHGTTDANCIKYLYDDGTNGVCDPGVITIKVQNVGTGTTRRSDYMYLSEDSDNEFITFLETNTYLSITYSGALGCAGARRKTGASVGIIN